MAKSKRKADFKMVTSLVSGNSLIRMEIKSTISFHMKESERSAWMGRGAMPQEEELAHGMEEWQSGSMRTKDTKWVVQANMCLSRRELLVSNRS